MEEEAALVAKLPTMMTLLFCMSRFEISVLKKLLKVQMQGAPFAEHANVVSFSMALADGMTSLICELNEILR